jgi:predicted RND superfamily exporter protein
MDKIAKFVTKKPKLVILISLLLLIPCIIGYMFTNVSYDMLSYLPNRLDSVKGEKILNSTYNYGSMTMVLVKNMPSKRVVELKNKIAEVEHVYSVIWVDDIVDTSIPSDILPDELKNVFYSNDGEYTMMLVQFSGDSSSEDTINAVNQIKIVTNKQCILSGLTPINADTKALSDKQAPLYIAVAVVLAILAMAFAMESFVLPFVLVGVLGIAVMYNMGTNFFLGDISYITQCIAAILQLGVTMDYSIFLVNRFNEEKLKTDDKSLAMQRALKASAVALSGSSLTTLFGFLALCFMQFRLGLNIGIVMSKGVLLGVATVIAVLPAFLLVFDNAINKYKHKKFTPDFSKIINFTIKRKKVFASLFIVLLIPAVILSANVKKYYNLSSTLPDTLDSVVALNTLKKEFNMTTSHFILVDDKLSSKKLTEMENRIKDIDGVNSLLAYNLLLGSSIPDSIIPDNINNIVKQGGYQLMLVNSQYEAASDESNTQVENINKIIKEYDPNGYVTGEGALYNDMIDITRTDFTVTSIISIFAIFVLVAILFKSFSIPAILIASIELAILINESISTIFGATIPFIAPTVISCVQLGATVDYAILLTSRFKEEINSGLDKYTAIREAANSSMRSVFQSAIVFFAATFGVYIVCSISIVKSICAMLSRGAIISAIVILFLLTPILLISEEFIAKTSKDWGVSNLLAKKIGYNGENETKSVHFKPENNNDNEEYTEFTITDDDDRKDN